jgi:WhiB family redox-sensing transcriptional regulator
MRRCIRCGTDKPTAQFRAIDGHLGRICGECQAAKARPAIQRGWANLVGAPLGDWADLGLCATEGAIADAWHPESEHPHGRAARIAVAICAECPVQAECLDHALAAGPHLLGIWGGTTTLQRDRIRAEGRRERHRILEKQRRAKARAS